MWIEVGVGRAEKTNIEFPGNIDSKFPLLLRSERNFPCRTYFTSFFCTALTFGKKWNDEGPTMQWMDDQPHLTIAQDRRAFIPRICGIHKISIFSHMHISISIDYRSGPLNYVWQLDKAAVPKVQQRPQLCNQHLLDIMSNRIINKYIQNISI